MEAGECGPGTPWEEVGRIWSRARHWHDWKRLFTPRMDSGVDTNRIREDVSSSNLSIF